MRHSAFICLLGSSLCLPSSGQDDAMPSAKLLEGVDVLQRVYDQAHPGLYRYNTKAQMADHFATLRGEFARTIKPVNRETGRAYENPIDEALTLDGTSRVAVRCFEGGADGRVRFAHSGPFHVDMPTRPLRPCRAEVKSLVRRMQVQIDGSAGVLPRPALDEYRQALGIYRERLETAR